MPNDSLLLEKPEALIAGRAPAPAPDPPAPAPSTATPSRKPKMLLGLLAGGIIMAAIAGGAWWYFRDRVSTDDAQIDGHIVPVASKIYGTVAEVLVNDNQAVKAGQVLVRIDPRDYQARVDQAKAALASAQSQAQGANATVPLTRETTASSTSGALAALRAAEAEVARAEVDLQRASGADIGTAQANVAAAQANYNKAQADLKRMQPLVAKLEISHQQYDAYVAADQVAQSQLHAAQQQLEAARQNAETRRAGLLNARAKVEQANAAVAASRANQQQVNVSNAQALTAAARIQQARADLEAAQLQLSYTVIVAPVDGVITRKTVELGQIVQQGQGLLTVVPRTDIWVTANYKETQLRNVHIGQKAEIKLDISGTAYPAHVDSIANATGARLSLLPPENATGNFVKVVQRIPVKIVFDNVPPGALLAPGMNVEATILTK